MVGLPRAIIKKYGVSKKAWAVFRGRKGKTHRKANKPKTSNRYVVRHMAKRKKSYSSRAKSFLSFGTITKFIKIGALVAPAIAVYSEQGGGLKGASVALTSYAGWDPATGNFNPAVLMRAWTPYIATSLITVGISKMNGIIRRL